MEVNENFKKFIIKEIKKTDTYKMNKKEIGKITKLNFMYCETKVLRNDLDSYCECSVFLCRVNNCVTFNFKLYTDGTIELYE